MLKAALPLILLIFLAGCINAANQQATTEQTTVKPVSNQTPPAEETLPAENQTIQEEAPQQNVVEIQMTARQWVFEPDTITVNKGDLVRLLITSTDVVHGFALPDYGINVVLEPGQTVIVEFVADKTGTFEFYCSVYCGAGHSQMRGTLIVQ